MYSLSHTKLKLKKTSATSLFTPILYSFTLFGIDLFVEETSKSFKLIRSLLSILFKALGVLATISGGLLLTPLTEGISQMNLAPFFLFITGLVFRIYLQAKKNDIARVIKMIENFKSLRIDPKPAKKRIVMGCISAITINITLFLAFLVVANTHGTAIQATSIKVLRGIIDCCPDLVKTGYFMIMISVYFFNAIPFSIFAILYCCLAWHLKQIVQDLKTSVTTSPEDLSGHFLTYVRIRSLVRETDEVLRTPMFMAVLHVSSNFYFTVFIVIHGNIIYVLRSVMSVLGMVFLAFLLFFMLKYAVEMSDVHDRITNIIHLMPDKPGKQFKRMEFVMKLQQGLFLTVGGMTPIRKGVFLVLIGNIVTYSLLIRSFPA